MSLLHSAVLVLNQSYELPSICSVCRALLLILRERAQIVERLEGVVLSVSQHYAIQSVVRLYKCVHVPRRNIVLSKSNVLKRDRYVCQYFGNKTKDLTVDHIIPRSKGGLFMGKPSR